MSQRRVIDDYVRDLSFTIDQLNRLVGIYKNLVECADTLNGVALASKKDIKESIKAAKKVECLIEELTNSVGYIMSNWETYVSLKAEYLSRKIDLASIETEIDEAVKIQGS